MVSLQNLYQKLEKQIQTVEEALKITDDVHCKLSNLTLIKNDLTQSYKSDAATSCRESEFRRHVFKFKNYPSIKNNLLEYRKGTKIKYMELCKLLTQYIFSNNLYDYENNHIICDELLKLITGCNTISFLLLLKNLGQIIK